MNPGPWNIRRFRVRVIVAGIIFFLTVFLIAGYLIVGFVRSRSGQVKEESQRSFDRFHLTNVDYTSFHKGVKLFSLEAEQIVHRKRKIGPLTINPIKEIEMTEVRIEVNQPPPAADSRQRQREFLPISMQQMLKEAISEKGLGAVSRVIINGLELIISSNGDHQFTLTAGKALLAFDTPKALLQEGFSIKSRWDDQLLAREAEWRNDTKRFVIHGAYVFRDAQGSHRDSRAVFSIGPEGRIQKE